MDSDLNIDDSTPKKIETDLPTNGDLYEHPSFGKIILGSYVGESTFFGSDIAHNNGMRITIKEATISRGLGQDWMHSKKPIVEIVLSKQQWAELISSVNMGDGVPCTIKYRQDKGRITTAKMPNKFDTLESEVNMSYKDSLDKIRNASSLVNGMLNNKTLKKSDLREVKSAIDLAAQDLSSNASFYMESAKEELDKMVSDAKHSVEGFIQHTASKLGIKRIKELFNSAKSIKRGE